MVLTGARVRLILEIQRRLSRLFTNALRSVETQLAGQGRAAEAADFTMKIGPVARGLAAGSVQSPDAVRSGLQAFF